MLVQLGLVLPAAGLPQTGLTVPIPQYTQPQYIGVLCTDCSQTNATFIDSTEFQEEMQNLKEDIQKFTKYYDDHY